MLDVATQAPPVERRAAPRFAPGQDVLCRLAIAVSGVVRPATIRDISVTGIDLVVQRPFEPGTHLAVELLNPSKKFARTMRVDVVHARPVQDGHWSVGFSFADPLSPEELSAML